MAARAIRILYVDDDPAFARLVGRALARRGYEVENVATGEEGIARAPGFDLIALDHHLPTGTGLDVLARLGEPRPPVVYVTAAEDTAIAVAALKAGAADYVAKTADDGFFELLGSAVDQALEKARLQRERDRAEREIREAKERAEMLLHEVNHRVANSLALVATLVRMQAGSIKEPAIRAALGQVQGRITAIAGVHRRLYTSPDVRSVEIADYLEGLVREIEATLREDGHASNVRLDAEPIQVPTDKAVSIGMVVTELVTNAFKYAYPSGAPGEIRVAFRKDAGGLVRLAVEDDGVGWNGKGTPKGTGLGNRIVHTLARGLNASLLYAEGGKGCRVRLEFEL